MTCFDRLTTGDGNFSKSLVIIRKFCISNGNKLDPPLQGIQAHANLLHNTYLPSWFGLSVQVPHQQRQQTGAAAAGQRGGDEQCHFLFCAHRTRYKDVLPLAPEFTARSTQSPPVAVTCLASCCAPRQVRHITWSLRRLAADTVVEIVEMSTQAPASH